MPPSYPALAPIALPSLWLMTDERIADLWAALAALPRGSGVVFRHHATAPSARRALFAQVKRVARARGLVLVRGGMGGIGHADGVHGPGIIMRGQIRTWAVHSRTEAVAGLKAGADLLFVSPLFATRSHPGARSLGQLRARQMVAGLSIPVIALGGMDAARFRRLRGFYGWAAIDALTAKRRV